MEKFIELDIPNKSSYVDELIMVTDRNYCKYNGSRFIWWNVWESLCKKVKERIEIVLNIL